MTYRLVPVKLIFFNAALWWLLLKNVSYKISYDRQRMEENWHTHDDNMDPKLPGKLHPDGWHKSYQCSPHTYYHCCASQTRLNERIFLKRHCKREIICIITFSAPIPHQCIDLNVILIFLMWQFFCVKWGINWAGTWWWFIATSEEK